MYTPRQWLLLPYINMDPSTQEGHRRLPHIHASKAPLIVHTLLGGRCLPTWCATGSSCLVYKFLHGAMSDRGCRRMGGEAEATGQIKRLMAPSLRIADQAAQCDCERSAWISLTKSDVPSCSLSTSSDWTIRTCFVKILFYSLQLQFVL